MNDKSATHFNEEMLDLHKKLLEAEMQRINGVKTYSLDEVDKILHKVIEENK